MPCSWPDCECHHESVIDTRDGLAVECCQALGGPGLRQARLRAAALRHLWCTSGMWAELQNAAEHCTRATKCGSKVLKQLHSARTDSFNCVSRGRGCLPRHAHPGCSLKQLHWKDTGFCMSLGTAGHTAGMLSASHRCTVLTPDCGTQRGWRVTAQQELVLYNYLLVDAPSQSLRASSERKLRASVRATA